jgi:hypothetical protein
VIADYLADRHPWLVQEGWTKPKIVQHETRKRPPETPPKTPLETPLDDEPDLGESRPLSRGVRSPRARAQEGLPQDHPLGQDQGSEVQALTQAVRAREPEPPATTNERPSENTHIRTLIHRSLEGTA